MIPKFCERQQLRGGKIIFLEAEGGFLLHVYLLFQTSEFKFCFPLPSEQLLLSRSEVTARFGSLTSEIDMCGKEVGY